MITEPIQYQRD